MNIDTATIERLKSHVNRQRLVETARRLIEVPSRTGEAGAVSDRLAEILAADGFKVERPTGGYPAAPAVVIRLESCRAGPTLQFDGHLDTVHLPFVPPRIEDDRLLTGSGASDMKGGVAAAVEAVRALRDAGGLGAGSILLTAHDLHEAPWGDGRQLDQLIRDGLVGDAVLLPEPICDVLPVAGRGCATWKVVIRRQGAPVHEVMRSKEEPSVIAAAAELVARLGRLEDELSKSTHPVCGSASVFIGQIHAGEIYNQYPQEALELPGFRALAARPMQRPVEREFQAGLDRLAAGWARASPCDWFFIRDAFARSILADRLVASFQLLAIERPRAAELPTGPKPFVDDGNGFRRTSGHTGDPRHGPRGRRTAHASRMGRDRRSCPGRLAVRRRPHWIFATRLNE